MLKSTEPAGFWQCSCTVQRTFPELSNFKYQIFCLEASGNLVEENMMYQHLNSISREKVGCIKAFLTNLGTYGQNILCTPKNYQLLHYKQRVFGGSECINRAILSTELSFAQINIKGCFHTNCNMSHVSTLQK